jgi:hypothetical protein
MHQRNEQPNTELSMVGQPIESDLAGFLALFASMVARRLREEAARRTAKDDVEYTPERTTQRGGAPYARRHAESEGKPSDISRRDLHSRLNTDAG